MGLQGWEPKVYVYGILVPTRNKGKQVRKRIRIVFLLH